MAAATATATGAQQSDVAQGFILYPKFELPQPVPYGRVPAPPAALPAWERKKLELGMAGASVEDSDYSNSNNAMNSPTNSIPRSPSKLHKQGSHAGVGVGPATGGGGGGGLKRSSSSFFNSLRSGSLRNGPNNGSRHGTHSRSSSLGNSNSAAPANGGPVGTGAGAQIHYDADGGIGNAPRKGAGKRNSTNPFMAYIKRHFSIQNHPDYARNGSSPSSLPSKSTKAVSSSQHSTKKTRSTGFADKMRLTSGKMSTKIQRTVRRLSSKSKPDELPQTWEEWRAAYARGNIDVNDVPPPPAAKSQASADGQMEESPYDAQYLPAPLPEDHRKRQLAFNRLDYEGKRGIKPSEIAVPEGEEQLPDTLDGHPAFRDIVSRARETFDTSIAILTVFNENRQLFLAETGLGGMKEVPREVTFCSHAVLQSPPEPFVLNDTMQDWRFANSPMVKNYGLRAYYGVPLLAPDFSGSSDDPVPIGTLCVIDSKPRANFTPAQRQKMSDLALLAQKTIANWSRTRLRARLDAMERSFQLWKSEAEQISAGPASMALYQDVHGQKALAQQRRMIEQQQAQHSGTAGNGEDPILVISKVQPGTPGADASADQASTTRQSHDGQASGPGASAGNAVLNGHAPNDGSAESYHTAPPGQANKQKIYDISTRLVSDSLELSLVYILRLDIQSANSTEPSSVRSLSLVSSSGLPSPEPAFDAVLHLKALRSEEGGLLYQNPNATEMRSGERMPQTEEVEYASALLVPVCESDTSGYVLAGFTDDPERVFERSDLEYMTTIASELAIYLLE